MNRIIIFLIILTNSILVDNNIVISKLFAENLVKFSDLDEQYIQKLFDYYKEDWSEDFNKKKLKKKLEKFVDSKDGFKFKEDEFIKLKDSRNRLVFLRENFYIFDKTHTPPPLFEEFVVKFGKVKDAYNVQKKKTLRKKSKELLELLEKIDFEKELKKFKPAKPSVILQEMQNSYEKFWKIVSNEKIPVHEFHDARKIVRRLAYITEILESEFPAERISDIRKKLGKINKYLDGRHDAYTQMKFLKEIDYDKSYIKISSEDRDKFLKLEKQYKRLLEFIETPMSVNARCLQHSLNVIYNSQR